MPKGSNLLKAIAGKRNQKAAAKPAKKDNRPVLQLKDAAGELLRQFAPVKIVFDKFKSRCDGLKSDLKNEVYQEWLDLMWEHKMQPENPSLEATSSHIDNKPKPDVKSMYIMSEKYKVQVPEFDEENESVEDAMTRTLVENVGMKKKVAATLVAEELDFTPQITTNWTGLLHGTYAGSSFTPAKPKEIEVAEKILTFLNDSDIESLELTEDERAIITDNQKTVHVCKVSPGFLDKACGYCTSRDMLEKLFEIITPEDSIKGATFGISDTSSKRIERLLEISNDMLNQDLQAD